MQRETVVRFRGVRPPAGLTAEIREKAEWLEKFYKPIIGCRVLVERPEQRGEGAHRYHVHIDLAVPGGKVIVSHQPGAKGTTLMTTAVRDAFDVARRRLQDYARRQRGDVKTHEEATSRRRR